MSTLHYSTPYNNKSKRIYNTLSEIHICLNFFHLCRYLVRLVRVFLILVCICCTSSITSGSTEMSVKKLNTYGSSSPSTFCGGHSIHVPCIQRGNTLVLFTNNNNRLVTYATQKLLIKLDFGGNQI